MRLPSLDLDVRRDAAGALWTWDLWLQLHRDNARDPGHARLTWAALPSQPGYQCFRHLSRNDWAPRKHRKPWAKGVLKPASAALHLRLLHPERKCL